MDLRAVNTWAKSCTPNVRQVYISFGDDDTNLVCLFSMLMLRLALKPIGPIHILRFMITTIDIHSLRIKP